MYKRQTWDGVPLPKLSVADLKQDAIQLFKDKAVKRGRLTKEEVSVEDAILMDNLHLIDEDGYLIRAAMLAFYKDPELSLIHICCTLYDKIRRHKC